MDGRRVTAGGAANTAVTRLLLLAVLMLDTFQFDSNGQNVQFAARKFILLGAWTLFMGAKH